MPGANTATVISIRSAGRHVVESDMECVQSAISGLYQSPVELAESMARLDARVRELKNRSVLFGGIEVSGYAEASRA